MGRAPTTFIIEGHRDCREVLALTLETFGFEVGTARSGGDALAALRDHTPESVVIDTALPDRHPLDVVRVLRANARFDATTIVLVSTWVPAADRAAAFAAGVDAVLLKPFVVEDLVSKVTRQRPRWRHQA